MSDTPAANMNGLSEISAQGLLARHGANILPSAKPKTAFAIAIQTMGEPMFSLLLACSALYWWLGDRGEAAMLSVAVLAVIILTFIQERRAEKTLEALRDLSSPRALVIRDGIRKRIAGRDVVPGDLLVLSEGDRVPADADVISSASLRVDESLLTGESMPVSKHPAGELAAAGKTDHSRSLVFSGTMVIQGHGLAAVSATGSQTRIGQIGTAIKNVEPPPSRVMVEVRKVVRWVAAISVLTSLLIITISIVGGKSLIDSVLVGLTFAMGTVPEEFPVVLTIFMAIGAWRISRKNVLTRQMTAIESLGSATYLCVDKTGTLTENRMRVTSLWTPAGGVENAAATPLKLNPSGLDVCRYAAMACAPDSADPVDMATQKIYAVVGERSGSVGTLMKSFPMVRPLLAVGCLWKTEQNSAVLAVKGAPESVLTLCSVDDETRESVIKAVEHLASRGERVLAVAVAADGAGVERLDHGRYRFVGLITFEDPLRSNVRESIAECHSAGIKVIMMTGDYPLTAGAVATQAGISVAAGILSGSEMSHLTDDELALRLKDVRVMARMVPEQKLRVVQALQKIGEVVAMTGDGVNDAPALRAADIGVAMGERGTDVAREASTLVLLDDQFSSIVAAVKLGRRIFTNLQTAMTYVIAIHIPVAGLALLPVLTGMPAILLPMHVALLQLMIDPVCSMVFEAEPEATDIMTRPPRNKNARIFSSNSVFQGLIAGLAALMVVIAVESRILSDIGQENHGRAVAFACLNMINFALITSLRPGQRNFSFRQIWTNKTLWFAIPGLIGLMAVIFYVEPVASALHFVPPHVDDLLNVGLIGVICAGVFTGLRKVPFLSGK